MKIEPETVGAVHTHTHTPSIQLINGDCYEKLKEIPSGSVDLVVIDPPYEFQGSGGDGAFGTKKRNYHEEYLNISNKNTREAQRIRVCACMDKQRENIKTLSTGFDISLFDELKRIMKKINIYVWCNKVQVRKILNYFDTCNIDILTWHKTNCIPTCNNTYLNDTEYLIMAREKGVKIYGTYETKHKYYVTKANVEDKKKYLHPTIKPLHIIKNLIINSSKEGDTVLDCFMGSGTTGVACKETGRNFIGIEIDKTYFDIAKERINNA